MELVLYYIQWRQQVNPNERDSLITVEYQKLGWVEISVPLAGCPVPQKVYPHLWANKKENGPTFGKKL